jgi:proteasome accessory factor C
VSERFAPLLGGFLPADMLEAVDGSVTAHFHLADPRWIKRLAARFGGAMEVLEPAVARSAAREWAASGLALYRRPDPQDQTVD